MADAQSLFSQLFDDTSIQAEQPAEPARQVRTRPALPQPATARPSNGAVTKPLLQEPAKPLGRTAPALSARPAQPSTTTNNHAQKAAVLTSKRPRDEPLIRAKNFVALEADESSGADDDESEEPSLSDDDEDALEAAEREAYDDQEYDDDEDEDDDEDDEPPAPRSRHTPSPKRGTAKPPSVPPAKPSKVTGQSEQQLFHKQAQLGLKEAELTKREAELAKKEALAVARDRDQTQKETELNELHLLVQRHHRAMMEQQAINHAVSDSIDKRLCVLEEQERKPKEVVVAPMVTAPLPVVFPPPPARTQIMLEREQVESMLPRQLVDELTYIALTQGRFFDLTAYRAPSDVADRDLVSIEVMERASGRFVHCQTRWPV